MPRKRTTAQMLLLKKQEDRGFEATSMRTINETQILMTVLNTEKIFNLRDKIIDKFLYFVGKANIRNLCFKLNISLSRYFKKKLNRLYFQQIKMYCRDLCAMFKRRKELHRSFLIKSIRAFVDQLKTFCFAGHDCCVLSA